MTERGNMTLTLVDQGFLADVAGDKPSDEALIVRPSSWSSFQLCGYRVSLAGEDGFDNTSSEPMAWGTGVHKLNANRIIFGDVADDMASSPAAVLGIWAQEMRDRSDGEDIFTYATRSYLLGQATEMLSAHKLWVERFWLPVGQHLEVVAVEDTRIRPLGVLPSGRDVWIRGTADFVTSTAVYDWKSAGRGWKRGKAESNIQHLIYAWLVEDLAEIDEAAYVVYNRQTAEWAWDDTTLPVTNEAIRTALHAMWDMAKQIDTGTTHASPLVRGGFGDGRGWHCSPKFCGAWSICPAKYLIADGKAGLPREKQKWE
jgi:hypothetical protein